MTAARLQVAFDRGLTVADLHKKHQQASAAALVRTSLEPVAVLTSARAYGLQWTDAYTKWAAVRNDLPLLQWLLKRGCACDGTSVAYWAQQHGNLSMLKCCHTAAPLHQGLKERLLFLTGKYGQLRMLQWLHKIGAVWPATFYTESDNCWTVPAVQWALANGCTWGSWKCQ
jgi:hypothetical protein